MDQKKIIIIGSISVLVVGMLVIGVVAYRARTAVETPPAEQQVPAPETGGSPSGIGQPASGGVVPQKGGTPTAPSGTATSSAQTGLPGIVDRTPDYTGATDTDKDGLPDARERILGTNPNKADTDGDGYSDGEEVLKYGSDPLDPKSTPKTIEGHDKFGL